MFERTGTSYICGTCVWSYCPGGILTVGKHAGHIAGGSWGFYEGLSKPEGRTTRLRMNSILNGVTRRGPFVGNTAASLGEREREREQVLLLVHCLCD